MTRSSLKSKSGFTLIELLVVIAIIGILSSVVLASLNTARAKARDARRVTDLKQLQIALELYFDTNNSYQVTGGAATWTEGRCSPPPDGWINKRDYTGANAYIPNLAPTYIAVLPGDPAINPAGARCYGYYSADGTTYYAWAHVGAEGAFDTNNPMIRLLPSACTTAQNTFFVASGGLRCF